jgi:hypothetical protein
MFNARHHSFQADYLTGVYASKGAPDPLGCPVSLPVE